MLGNNSGQKALPWRFNSGGKDTPTEVEKKKSELSGIRIRCSFRRHRGGLNIKLVFLGTLPGNVTLEPRFN